MQLLNKIGTVSRGLTATKEDKAEIESLAKELEGLNAEKDPLNSPLVNGEWELLYTTSSSILGTSRPPFLRPQGSIYQLIGKSPKKGLVKRFLLPVNLRLIRFASKHPLPSNSNLEYWNFSRPVVHVVTPASQEQC